jgi:hypothetical protein
MSAATVPQPVTVRELEAEVLRRFPNPEDATLEQLQQAGEELSLKFHVKITLKIEIKGKKGGSTTIIITVGA